MSTREGTAMVADKVGGGQTHWLFGHLARPVITWLVTTSAKYGAPPWPYKYPHIGESRHTHHILVIPLAKLSFLV
jgi:hypothetical protein